MLSMAAGAGFFTPFASSSLETSRARLEDLRALVSPPVALALDVFARSLPEIGSANDDDLEALRPGLVASPRAGRDAHRVPLLELDDLVVELHPPAPAHDHVHLLLLLMRVAVREAIVGRDALIAQAAVLELERLARVAELKVRRAVEVGPEILQILPEVPQRERHGRDPTVHQAGPCLPSIARVPQLRHRPVATDSCPTATNQPGTYFRA